MPGRIKLPGKRNKFGNIPVVVDGFWFQSSKEGSRWMQLKLLQEAGEICRLERQVPYMLHASCLRHGVVGKIVIDFRYRDLRIGKIVVEDVKGGDATKTPFYRWKKRHLELEYGIIVQEV